MLRTDTRSDARTNVIVTGIPRSGTTLVAALLDATENTICLREPDKHVRWLAEARSAETYVDAVIADYHRIRDRIRAGLPILDRRLARGQPQTNYFPPRQHTGERRAPTFKIKEVDTRHLRENFTLAMKHNVEYTSVLPELVASGGFTILCPIRHPIATVLSWNTLTTPVARGEIPMATFFWPDVERCTQSITDLIERQVIIFDLFCERYWVYRAHINLIYYERLVEDQALIARMMGRRQRDALRLSNSNRSHQYDWDLAPKIYTAILNSARSIHHFYTDAQLRALLP